MSQEASYPHITRTAGVCGGKPRIAGHRITVQHVALEHDRLGMSPDDICTAHPGLTLGEVHAALAYFFDHREEIMASIAADERLVEEMKRQAPLGVS